MEKTVFTFRKKGTKTSLEKYKTYVRKIMKHS